MIIVTGEGKIKKNLGKEQVIAELKAAQKRGDRYCSITGAYAEGLNPAQLEKEAGYRGATEAETISDLERLTRNTTANYTLRDIPKAAWNEYQAIAKRNGITAAEALRHHIIITAAGGDNETSTE